MKVSCVLLVNDPCRQLQNRFTPPARPWFASGGGHMPSKPFVVGGLLCDVGRAPEARHLARAPDARRREDGAVRGGRRNHPARNGGMASGPVGGGIAWQGVGNARARGQRDRAVTQPPPDVARGGAGGRCGGGRAPRGKARRGGGLEA